MSEKATQNNENADQTTIDSFGDEWSRFDQSELSQQEHEKLFQTYFGIFPWEDLPEQAQGFDMGCGSGRWAKLVAPRVHKLMCIDPAQSALKVAETALSDFSNVTFHHAQANAAPLKDGSQDFGYALGVLHHIPDTAAALAACTKALKPGAPFLLYLYYRFDNRPLWFRAVWKLSESFRALVSRLPDGLKPIFTNTAAALVYWPLARLSLLVEKLGMNPASLPLSFYRNCSFYTLRTDSRDRFGTPLEQRFTRDEITQMMSDAGLDNIRFSNDEPYWVAVGLKQA